MGELVSLAALLIVAYIGIVYLLPTMQQLIPAALGGLGQQPRMARYAYT